MKPHASAALICLVTLFASAARGGPAPSKAASIGVTVAEVLDSRTTGAQPSECRLVLSLSGDAVVDAYTIREIRVLKAVDELGRDLVKPVDMTSRSFDVVPGVNPSGLNDQRRLDAVAAEVARRREIREGLVTSGASGPIRITPPAPRPVISLRSPSRQSATIKSIEGEIELFNPTEENGGVLRLPGILEQPAEPIKHDSLATAGVQLMYLTPDAYEAKRATVGDEAKDPVGPWSDQISSYVKTMSKPSPSGHPSTVYFFLHDPHHQVMGLELQTHGRQPLVSRAVGSFAELRILMLDAPPPSDAQLVLRIAAPHALAVYPFKLENVALP